MDDHHSPIPVQRGLLTPSRLLAVAFIAVSAVSAAWIVREEPALSRVALLSGTPLPTSELALMEAAFDRANLTDYSIEGGRIHVPKHRQSAYMRALVDAQALPKEFGGSLRRALESNSPWQSRSIQQELLRVATQEELSLVLCSMPGIRRASVLYDSEEHPGAGREKTASVNIETEDEASMSPERIRAIRVLVAASIAGLAADRVAVTDLRSGRVFAGPLDNESPLAAVDPAVRAQASYEEHLAGKVRQAIGFVKGAIVDVSVTFAEAAPPRQVRAAAEPPAVEARANAPAEVAPPPRPLDLAAAPGPSGKRMLDTVQVSVAVPETYFRSLLERTSSPLDPRAQVEVEDREIERIRDHVARVLPPADDADSRKVAVTKFPVIASAAFRQDGLPAADDAARLRDEAVPAAQAVHGGQPLSKDEEVISVRLPASLARLVSREDGAPLSLTRESLLGGTSLLFALLACMFWVFGRPSSRTTLLLLAAAFAVGPSAIAADDIASPVQAANAAAAVDPPSLAATAEVGSLAGMLERLFAGRSLGVSLSAAVVFGVASLAPAVLLMTTAFVRLSVVLSLVRQGIGTPQLPSNQVVTSLAIFLTALVMWPVWTAVWRDGVEPFTEGRVGLSEAFDAGSRPLKRWMTGQIEAAGNADTLGFFVARAAAAGGAKPAASSTASGTTAPIEAILPAFLVSELEVAFAIGLRLLVPFLVLDVVVGSIITAMGLVTLSPATVALPLKLLVFVLADGWTLIVKSLLDGFAAVA
jgi:flagellar biosynthetic protein FliP